jgi:hypothetical protein
MIAHNGRILSYNNRIRYTLSAEAQAFVNAAGITSMSQVLAINYLVDALKAYSLWGKMKAVYPFIGGTADSHKYNLINPVDSNAAYRLTYYGTITHDSNGIQGDGSTGYADTNISPANNLTDNSTHLCVYIRNNATSDMFDLGVNQTISGTVRALDLSARFLNNLLTRSGYLSIPSFISNSNTTGCYIGSRTANNYIYVMKNRVLLHSSSSTNTLTMPTYNLLFMALGSGANYKSSRQYAFASIGDGLTPEEALRFQLIVQQYNTLLGRQV